MKRWVSLLLTLVVTIGGFATLAWATDGWTLWTAETTRRQAVLDRRMPLPDVSVQRETGAFTNLHSFNKPILIIDFIFSRCYTACMIMGYRFSRLQSTLSSAAQDIQFLSISFDHENDGPEELSGYLRRFSANPANWSALRITDKRALDKLLESLGVIVLPDPELGYVHNAAIYLVRNHEITGIYDVDDTSELVEKITLLN